MTSTELTEKLARLAWQKKGKNISILDVRKLTDVTDYFIIVSGESAPHVKSLFDFLDSSLRKEGIKAWHKEGQQNLSWVLLDYVEVVVHIFKDSAREYYALEKLWGDAQITQVEEDVPDRNLLENRN